MIPYLGCEGARQMLQPFVDGELPLAEQVLLESHLRWCKTCSAHVEDLRLIGDSIRLRSADLGSGHQNSHNDRALAGLQAAVLSRIRAERAHSFTAKVHALFEDRHLLWAACGATTAVIVCLFATMSVLHAATEERRPDSLAGRIESLANPGSDGNPVRLDGRIAAPRSLPDAPALDHMPVEDAVFALAAVVTREGRIANYELLQSERYELLRSERVESRRHTAATQREEMVLLNTVSRSRFAPAYALRLDSRQAHDGAPVAVNMIWLLARTTVKGSPRDLDVEPPYVRTIETLPAPPVSKPPSDDSPSANRALPGRSTTV